MVIDPGLITNFKYDSTTGHITRIKSAGNVKAGSLCNTLSSKGYVRIFFNGSRYLAHRLAWLFTYGYWPENQVDHINGNKTDNRISNLRCVNTSTNCTNQRAARINNKLGIQGVHLIKSSGRFRAICSVNKRTHHLGVFDTAEEASIAYETFKNPYMPEIVKQ